jgi:hypothetical protein
VQKCFEVEKVVQNYTPEWTGSRIQEGRVTQTHSGGPWKLSLPSLSVKWAHNNILKWLKIKTSYIQLINPV